MRTKALLCAAALAAGIATSMAQSNVYSLNVVGYYNVTIPAGALTVIANQFNTTNNTLGALIPNPAPGSFFYKYVGGSGWVTYNFDEFDLKWLPDANVTLNPGEGGFFRNVTTSPVTLTFVGEVPQGNLTNALPTGLAIRSSMVPQSGAVTADLGYPAVAGDFVYKYVPGTGWVTYNFDEFDLKWLPSEPAFGVGEGFFSRKTAAVDWVRNFTVQ